MTIRVGDRVRIVERPSDKPGRYVSTLVGLCGTVVAVDDTDTFLNHEVQLDGDPADCPTPFDRDELVYTS